MLNRFESYDDYNIIMVKALADRLAEVRISCLLISFFVLLFFAFLLMGSSMLILSLGLIFSFPLLIDHKAPLSLALLCLWSYINWPVYNYTCMPTVDHFVLLCVILKWNFHGFCQWQLCACVPGRHIEQLLTVILKCSKLSALPRHVDLTEGIRFEIEQVVSALRFMLIAHMNA